MAHAAEKQTLTAELAAAREELTGYTSALRRDCDFSSRLKAGVRRSPAAWYGGAALLGLLLSRLPARRQKVVVKGNLFRSRQAETAQNAGKAAFGLAALKIVIDLARPAIMAWVKDRYFRGRSFPVK